MLQIVASLTDGSRGIIYDPNMFIVQATEQPVNFCKFSLYFGKNRQIYQFTNFTAKNLG